MLPQEYFGTFDMVLVDLSETVMSGKVTKGLDILGALSLLLKEDGIFVKNELYLDQMSEIFKHSLQIHYYDVSVICSQCLILGSNSIDFVHTTPTDHGVKTRVTGLEDINDHYKVMHSYTKNPQAKMVCTEDDNREEEEADPEEQESSPGILLVLEAENALGELDSPDKIESAIVPALEKVGLTVLSTLPFSGAAGSVVVTAMLQEGYVVVRTLPNKKYCAFDVHFWSAFSKLEDTKIALLNAVQSDPDESSSFRIVAGGLFGVKSWKEDEKSRGPQKLKQHCGNKSDEISFKPTASVNDNQEAVNVILDESLSLIPKNGAVAMILCGLESEPCDSVNKVSKHEFIEEAIPIWSCVGSASSPEQLTSSNSKFDCENRLYAMLDERAETGASKERISVIVVDPNAPKALGQVLLKIVAKDKKVPWHEVEVIRKRFMHRNNANSRIFDEDLLVLSPVLSPVAKTEEWRKIFAEKFRSLILKEPGFLSSILYNNSESGGGLEMTTFRSGDEWYIAHINNVASNVEKRTGWQSDLRTIEGGLPTFQDNFVSDQIFSAAAYDTTDTYKQWLSQQPWGHQTIIQMEFPSTSKPVSTKMIRDMLEKAISSTKSSGELLSQPKEFTKIGDGCAIVAAWSNGMNVVVLWDGRKHIDINLFALDEDPNLATEFADNFRAVNPNLKNALRDEMPRGYGRVVNFMSDIGDRATPYWAEHVLAA